MTSWDQWFLGLAKYVSTRSKDPSTKVGAVIVRPDKSVCSVGFNGLPARMLDNPQWLSNREEKYSRMVHAEINALLFARERVSGYTLYTTFMPCDRCLTQLVQAGITRFVYAPASPNQLERWGEAFNRSSRYGAEMGVEMVEIACD